MFEAMAHNDQAVTAAGGIALRYGGFYGDEDNAMITAVGKRQFPLIGDGGGIMSFIHLDDAAAATVLALDADGPAHLQRHRRRARPDARLAARPRRRPRREAALPRPRLGRRPAHGQDCCR